MRCCGAADFRDYTNLGMVIPTTCKTIDKNFVSAPVSSKQTHLIEYLLKSINHQH